MALFLTSLFVRSCNGTVSLCTEVDRRAAADLLDSTAVRRDPRLLRPHQQDTTVICPTYYLTKFELPNTCAGGGTLVEGGSELTQGSWFVHRLLHSPTASGGGLSDVVDTVAEALELAAGVNVSLPSPFPPSEPANAAPLPQASQAITSIHSVQYYALDTYAIDILLPGVAFRGDPKHVKRDLARYPVQLTH